MTKTFAPLLAKEADFSLIDWNAYPWYISPKLDGIRAIIRDGVVMSRKLLPIPNAHVQKLFGRPEFEHLDGELIVGAPADKDVYNRTYSGVMKATGEPDVMFFVFDHIEMPHAPYSQRLKAAQEQAAPYSRVSVLGQVSVDSEETCRDMEQHYLGLGFEGAMLRRGDAPYKFGRSTPREGTLLKIKRFTDSEATIVGSEEEMRNDNEATTDELGRTKRSSHAENKVGKGRLGALVCETATGVRFNIGTGFNAAQRESLWAQRKALPGKLVKYKHFEIGAQEAPRFPVFIGFRSELDL